jgi:hypothetical protein
MSLYVMGIATQFHSNTTQKATHAFCAQPAATSAVTTFAQVAYLATQKNKTNAYENAS